METRVGNAEEVSNVEMALHHHSNIESKMYLLNECLSVHDQPEMKVRALEFIRRWQEFGGMLGKLLPPERRATGEGGR